MLAQHMKALSACDWTGLMAQYPDQYQLRGGNSAVPTSGRVGPTGADKVIEAFGKGGATWWIHFDEVNRLAVGNTITVTWKATGTNPATDKTLVPYYESDAYVNRRWPLVSMVSPFGDFPLQHQP